MQNFKNAESIEGNGILSEVGTPSFSHKINFRLNKSANGITINNIEIHHVPTAQECIDFCGNRPQAKSKQQGFSVAFQEWQDQREQKRVMEALM